MERLRRLDGMFLLYLGIFLGGTSTAFVFVSSYLIRVVLFAPRRVRQVRRIHPEFRRTEFLVRWTPSFPSAEGIDDEAGCDDERIRQNDVVAHEMRRTNRIVAHENAPNEPNRGSRKCAERTQSWLTKMRRTNPNHRAAGRAARRDETKPFLATRLPELVPCQPDRSTRAFLRNEANQQIEGLARAPGRSRNAWNEPTVRNAETHRTNPPGWVAWGREESHERTHGESENGDLVRFHAA